MKLNINFLGFLICFVFGAITFQSCSEGNSLNPSLDTQHSFKLFLTDCPFEAEEVNVEILTVILEDEDGNEESLTTNSGIYNLLDFTNGVDTLLAFGNVDLDDIEHIYFELGDQNTIVVDGQTFPLELKNGNIVKVKVNLDKLEDEDFLVDFYACTSIIKNNSGYSLKPVIKFKGKRLKSEKDDDEVEDFLEDFEACYTVVYPISLLDEDGNQLTAASKDELVDILLNNEIKDLVYPINLMDKNNESISINSEEDLAQLEDCDEEDDEEDDEESEIEELLEDLEDCFTIVYPISLIDKNGNTLTANNADQLEEILDGNDEITDLVYPSFFTDTESNQITVNNLDELKELESCDYKDDEENDFEELVEDIEECYDLVFPVSFTDQDGNTFTATDENQLDQLLDEDTKIINFIFPFKLIDEKGNSIEIRGFGFGLLILFQKIYLLASSVLLLNWLFFLIGLSTLYEATSNKHYLKAKL